MNIIATTLKSIIEAQGLTYLRAANPSDLNELVGNYDLSAGVGVYANLPTVDNITYSQTNNVLMEYGIEVYYLKVIHRNRRHSHTNRRNIRRSQA